MNTLKQLVVLAALTLHSHPGFAQSTPSILAPPAPVEGIFYFDINGRAEVFQNGILICKPAAGGRIIYSDPLPLNVGDRIVVKLATLDGRFRFAFRSMDGKQQIDFKRRHVKTTEYSESKVDYTPEEYPKFKQAKEGVDRSKKDFGLPMYPDFIWGGERKSWLAVTITKDMFKTPPPESAGYNQTEIRPKGNK